ncbi:MULTISPECIES: hypothetical protein [Nocardioides]|uniref:MarR family transcriptional regulator n=1 Tax=Nocardioides vastitatis TaxID=2568655 RepID=A0ABW0ZPA5_9ACTN|nr:hypothetical protein [Nocardioides sp.]THJ13717.1 hypothetical protein E7Z54_01530 [Nocardioides sp.]
MSHGRIVVHYSNGLTGATTIEEAAERLGVTVATYQRVFDELVSTGYLSARDDGSYDEQGRLL